METKNIILAGVGGQGTVLISKILTKGLIEAGYDVKMSEIHGMAQRGGSVQTQVRFGDEVVSAVIGHGQADVLVSFETMEALRYLNMLKANGVVITNNVELPSAPITAGLAEYPEGILDDVKARAKTYVVPATEKARELGNEKVMNVILFGALAKILNLEGIDWEKLIEGTVKETFTEINKKAFNIGQEFAGGEENA
ncbi:MAG: indolepyruvate oxidoreductase subunit beta [Tissierellia bacterium]|nr:indolepyruvate oxidoreductase subunit beta [Tissierellia bacterium]